MLDCFVATDAVLLLQQESRSLGQKQTYRDRDAGKAAKLDFTMSMTIFRYPQLYVHGSVKSGPVLGN